jgi:hypothetical protein
MACLTERKQLMALVARTGPSPAERDGIVEPRNPSPVRCVGAPGIGYLLAAMLVPATTLVAAFSGAAVGFGSMGELNAVLRPVLLFVLIALIGLLPTVTYLAHIHSFSAGEEVQS